MMIKPTCSIQLLVLARVLAAHSDNRDSAFKWAKQLRQQLVMLNPTAFVQKMTDSVVLHTVQNANTVGGSFS